VRLVLAFALLGLIIPHGMSGQEQAAEIPESEIRAFIAKAKALPLGRLLAGCTADAEKKVVGWHNRHVVQIADSRAAIAAAAWQKEQKYLTYTVADVRPLMRRYGFYLYLAPEASYWDGRQQVRAAPVENVVLRSAASQEAVVRPAAIDIQLNAIEQTTGDVEATFPANSFDILPPGDVDIVVITTHGQRTCRVRASERAALTALGAPTEVPE
jgi:hypothetical protein